MEISETADNREDEVHSSMATGRPHEALFLALAYFPIYELLAMSGVCGSLREAVNKDILPWLDMVMDRPLSSRLSDDILLKITSKANGRLRSLALVNCSKITDAGLLQIVEKNPLIAKLHVPACTGLTPEGVVKAVKTGHNLISLKVNGIYNINKEHLEALRSTLESNRRQLIRQQQATDIDIDIDICPNCNCAAMVLECPSRDKCERKKRERGLQRACRGCYHCIPRCVECGMCVDECEAEDTACADAMCSNCWLRIPKCNFCNKPYCSRHAHRRCIVLGSSGFFYVR